MYESFFGLSASPFRLSPDPSFLFESRGYRKAHSYFAYGVSEGEGFIVITGEVGAGKTMLAQALLAELDPQQVLPVHLVSTQLESDDLLRAVAIAFGLPAKDVDKAQLLGSIQAFLAGLSSQGRRALLIVDEAQNLSARAIEELRMLSNFQEGDRPMLQTFLIGQPELREMIRDPSMEQFRQRIIATYHLGPIGRDETGAYIERRLRNVGWQGDPAFDPEAAAAIHRESAGIPRRINALCNRLMIRAFMDQRHQIGARDVARVAGELREEWSFNAEPEALRPAGTVGRHAGSQPMRPQVLSAIAARLDTLERSLRAVVDLARSIAVGEPRSRTGGRTRRG